MVTWWERCVFQPFLPLAAISSKGLRLAGSGEKWPQVSFRLILTWISLIPLRTIHSVGFMCGSCWHQLQFAPTFTVCTWLTFCTWPPMFPLSWHSTPVDTHSLPRPHILTPSKWQGQSHVPLYLKHIQTNVLNPIRMPVLHYRPGNLNRHLNYHFEEAYAITLQCDCTKWKLRFLLFFKHVQHFFVYYTMYVTHTICFQSGRYYMLLSLGNGNPVSSLW